MDAIYLLNKYSMGFFKLEQSNNRVFGLDLLRFVAIFMVLLGHSLILAPKYLKPFVYKFLFDGVAIFFVLSGFLIGGILIKQLNKEKPSFNGLVDFWKRRWMRTLPAYLVILIFLLIYTAFLIPKNLPDDWFRFFFFTQNLFAFRPSFFAEAWSLSIEEWFYLSVPLLLFGALMLFKSSIKWTILFVSLLVLVAVTYYRFYLYHAYPFPSNPAPESIKAFKKYIQLGIEYQVVPRLDAIMFGVVASFIAYYTPKFWQHWIKYVLFLLGIYILYLTKYYMGKSYAEFAAVWVPTLKSLAIFLMLPLLANMKNGLGKWTKWVTYFSLISYSMYLVNLNIVINTLIKNTIHGVYGEKHQPGEFWYLDYLLFWIFTIFISTLMYKYIEIPFMKLRDAKKNKSSN
jgi:peptidoglycan/LPS O-acetylase OafA/YrhL